jgi:hypothetical protein
MKMHCVDVELVDRLFTADWMLVNCCPLGATAMHPAGGDVREAAMLSVAKGRRRRRERLWRNILFKRERKKEKKGNQKKKKIGLFGGNGFFFFRTFLSFSFLPPRITLYIHHLASPPRIKNGLSSDLPFIPHRRENEMKAERPVSVHGSVRDTQILMQNESANLPSPTYFYIGRPLRFVSD